jgi:hypothetical protein
MEPRYQFDLKLAVDNWLRENCKEDVYTPADIIELEDQIYCSIDELQEGNGLKTEEAFVLATYRVGDRETLESQRAQANEDNLQLKKVVLLFGGVLVYFILYHLVICLSQLYYISLDYLNNDPVEMNIYRVKNFVLSSYFVVAAGITSLFFMHSWVVLFLRNFKFTPPQIILGFIALLFLFFAGRHMTFEMSNLIKSERDLGYFVVVFKRFKVVFPVLFSFGFVVLYFRYRDKFNIHQ